MISSLLGVDEKSLSAMGFVGYAYDSEDDFRLARDEATREFPSVDFSAVKFA